MKKAEIINLTQENLNLKAQILELEMIVNSLMLEKSTLEKNLLDKDEQLAIIKKEYNDFTLHNNKAYIPGSLSPSETFEIIKSNRFSPLPFGNYIKTPGIIISQKKSSKKNKN